MTTEATSQSSGRLYDRYMKHEAQKGWIGSGGLVEVADEPQEPSPNEPSLQERLQDRKPSLFPTPSMDPDKVRGSDG